jgi:phage tail protein X
VTGEATIRRGDRAAIVGRTGSGKSVMLRWLLARYSRAVLVDPKGRAVMDGWPVHYGVAAFRGAWPATPRVIVRPGAGENRRDWLDAVCWHIYRHGETALGVDEVIGVVDANRAAAGFDAVLTQGRELGITALVCTQRPSRIPPTIVSEADHLFVFTLNLADDRRRVSETIGPYASPADRSFRYVYWSGSVDRPIECAPLTVRPVNRGEAGSTPGVEKP